METIPTPSGTGERSTPGVIPTTNDMGTFVSRNGTVNAVENVSGVVPVLTVIVSGTFAIAILTPPALRRTEGTVYVLQFVPAVQLTPELTGIAVVSSDPETVTVLPFKASGSGPVSVVGTVWMK